MIHDFNTFCNEDYYAGAKLADVNKKLGRKLTLAQSMAASGTDEERIRKTTGWFTGKFDKKWRYELIDRIHIPENKFRENYSKKGEFYAYFQLRDIIKDSLFFKAYPKLRYVQLTMTYGENVIEGGYYKEGSPETATYSGKVPEIGADGPTLEIAIISLVHEIQHAIQHEEDFEVGAHPSDFEYEFDEETRLGTVNSPEVAFDKYLAAPGEVEARDVEKRYQLSPEERKNKKPYSSE